MNKCLVINKKVEKSVSSFVVLNSSLSYSVEPKGSNSGLFNEENETD